jgi:hypothetical protein
VSGWAFWTIAAGLRSHRADAFILVRRDVEAKRLSSIFVGQHGDPAIGRASLLG